MVDDNIMRRYSENVKIFANAYLSIEPIKGLKYKLNLTPDFQFYRYNYYMGLFDCGLTKSDLTRLTEQQTRTRNILVENLLTFDRTFGDHKISVLAGYTYQDTQYRYLQGSGQGMPTGITEIDAASQGLAVSGNSRRSVLTSILGRVFYSYKDRYLITATIRRDGSSRFGSNHRYGNFPSVSVGWNIAEEDFVKDNLSWLDQLKLRGGYGVLGNQEISDYAFVSVVSTGINYPDGKGGLIQGAFPKVFASPDIKWEETAMTNVGIDGTFFNQQLTASVTWFNKKTVDMLVPTVALGTLGQATIPDSNIGEMLNRGWEIEAGFHQNLQSGFYYDLSMNLSFVKNKVLKLYGNNNFISSVYYGRQNQEISRTYEGDPIASFYGWKTDGLYQNMEEIANDPNIANDPRKANITPGDVRFVDMNNDGVIDEGDRTYLGDPNPNTTLGFQAKFGYKGFDLSMNFIGSFGAELYNADRMQGLDPSYSYNMYAETLNRWHGEGTSNSIPKMSTLRTNMNHRTSDLFIENGDYFKLKTMTLGYTFPKKWTDPINIHSLRLFVTAENLFTITSYSGYSPEIGYTDGNKQRGVDYAQYPMSRKFTFGLKVNF